MTALQRPKSVSVRISGRVQGVCFRTWTGKQAVALGLDGWVRNRTDGTVEAVFRGPALDVDKMVANCRSGPPAALVSKVEAAPGPHQVATGFRLLPTK
ncbi:MAG: acylphosphatase [Sphingomonadales bacterium]